ncbi:DUF397 domain-containing protein [Micromonospora sp. CPCC 205371]|nr:DUF397 domain-containing protein [Micromonospora sp. CPCC 205371]
MAGAVHVLWRQSSYCESNACVEVALAQPLVAVRDGKDRTGPVLTFEVEQWRAFVAAIRDHEL